MKELIKKFVFYVVDILLAPVNYLFLLLWRIIRYYGIQYFPIQRMLIRSSGVLPIQHHYYQPQFLYSDHFDPEKKRDLKLDSGVGGQMHLLGSLQYSEELKSLVNPQTGQFQLSNGSFEEGDADLYYLMIRNYKPKKIIEIGSGHSTKLARLAVKRNRQDGDSTSLTCIEPFENKWLDAYTDITVIRKKVEEIGTDFFDQLTPGDFLFIDSSHIIRPESDVLFIYLQVLPNIPSGVYIHVHDIFTPRHYPANWTHKEFRMWNEQYLLETILTYSDKFEVLFPLNQLFKEDPRKVQLTLSNVSLHSNPSSFWMKKC